jgi:hypothetical protein
MVAAWLLDPNAMSQCTTAVFWQKETRCGGKAEETA